MPFTSKQRSHLRAMASTMKPIGQVGKEGITETLVESFSEALEARELIKITLLPTAGEERDERENLALNLADLLGAELVAVIGRKAVFYRRSSKKNFEHIEF